MIVVFGTVCLDRVRRLPRLPEPGGYVEIDDETVVLGGEAANTAIALTAWGDRPVLASNPLGGDSEGEDLRNRVRARGLDLRELRSTRPATAPVCDVLVTPDGERTMIGRGFSALDRTIDLTHLPLTSGGWFTAEPNMEDASRRAVRMAQQAGMRTYLMDFLRPTDPIAPDSIWQSSTDWAGVRGDPEANQAYVDALVARTGAFCILSDGANGLVAGGQGMPARWYPPFPTPALVDMTGAGDMFRAGMLHGLSRGWKMNVCLQFASVAGCLSVGYLGASGRVPTLQEIAAHLANHPDIVVSFT